MRVGIIGGTIHGNRGAEAMVSTAIGRITDVDPEASYLLLSYLPEEDSTLLSSSENVDVAGARPQDVAWLSVLAVLHTILRKLRLRFNRWPSTFRMLRSCDILIDVSGISFHDGRLPVVAYNVLSLLPAMLLGVPVIRLSQAMGPFENAVNRISARYIMNRCLHSYVRGERSAEYVRGLKCPNEKWSVAADVAFGYEDEYSLTDENEDRVVALCADLDHALAGEKPLAAIVPSSLVLKKSGEESLGYLEALSDLIRKLNARGYHIVVLPNATRQGSSSLRNNDLIAVTRLLAHLKSTGAVASEEITAVQFDVNTRSIREFIQRSDLLVTSRFHAMVAGLSLEVPTLVLGWSHKYAEVLDMFGCADLAVDYKSPDELADVLQHLLANKEEIRERIAYSLPSAIASSRSQFQSVTPAAVLRENQRRQTTR